MTYKDEQEQGKSSEQDGWLSRVNLEWCAVLVAVYSPCTISLYTYVPTFTFQTV